MSRVTVAVTVALSMLFVTPAGAVTPEKWGQWADHAEALSAYLENLTPDPSRHDGLVIDDGVRSICRGTSTSIGLGGFPKWGLMLAAMCDAFDAMSKGQVRSGRACGVLQKDAREMAKGVPVPEAPRVDPARLRLISNIEAHCGHH